MSRNDDEQLRDALKKALSPGPATELAADLWPRMLRKLDERPQRGLGLDWLLLALAALWCLLFPSVIPGLMYHL